MKVLFACGGTAGHINPALATADYIKREHPDALISFVGNPRGMEAALVPRAGYPFYPVVIKGFYRSFSPRAIAHNVSALGHMLAASGAAKRILRDFSPDLVMGTGGYVSGPILRTAAKLGYKTVTHEQNAFPGVTTKLLSKYVDKVLLAVPEAEKHLAPGKGYVVVGNPVRAQVLTADREQSRRALGIAPGRLALLTFGGSLGAQCVNEAVADLLRWHWQTGKIHHIHATGKHDAALFPQLLQQRGVCAEGAPYIDIREYIDDMPRCLAACDLVVCRAGAITISELQAAGRASILIPSPYVAENHQYHNAMALQNRGAAIVVEEKDLTGGEICALVQDLLEHPQKLAALSANAKAMAITDAAQRIYQELMKLL